MIEREISFDGAAYSADAIQRAAYRFSDRLALDLRRENGNLACRLLLHDDVGEQADAIEADFRIEVLDQTLRERIRAETEGVRNVILALAFSNTGLTDPGE